MKSTAKIVEPLRPLPDRRYVSLTQAQFDMDMGVEFLDAEGNSVFRADLLRAGLKKVSVVYADGKPPAKVVL